MTLTESLDALSAELSGALSGTHSYEPMQNVRMVSVGTLQRMVAVVTALRSLAAALGSEP